MILDFFGNYANEIMLCCAGYYISVTMFPFGCVVLVILEMIFSHVQSIAINDTTCTCIKEGKICKFIIFLLLNKIELVLLFVSHLVIYNPL